MNAASLWDPLQSEVLQALGHPLYRTAPAAVGHKPDDSVPDDRVLDDPFVHALLRAAGRTHASADAARLAKGWPAPQTLRRDPRAKRALWPQLRALRRSAT